MDIGGGTIRARPAMRLNRPRGCIPLSFFSLLGPNSLEALSGSTIAEQTTQELGKQTSHAALWNYQVVSITRSIPVSHTIPQLAP